MNPGGLYPESPNTIALIGNHLPRQCGIATFTTDLLEALSIEAPEMDCWKDNQLLLFDGHHSMLAYMNAGKRYLEEIPHIIIQDKDKGHVDDRDIIVFYGEHAKAIKNYGWKDYVINWQAVKEKQLCRRVQRDMGELFCAIKDRIK